MRISDWSSDVCSSDLTRVLCTASVEERGPAWKKDGGWVTAEYGMLPRATHDRSRREAAQGKQSGRTQEIQRLIGRSLRACVDLKALAGLTITIDCDVLQADGGPRKDRKRGVEGKSVLVRVDIGGWRNIINK